MANCKEGGHIFTETGDTCLFCTEPKPEQEFSLSAYWRENAKNDKGYRTTQERQLLLRMFSCYDQLKHLGWNDAMYCPKDGSKFLSISAGSTGVCITSYRGEWPTGTWWGYEAGDVWPLHPILWKPIP